MIATSVSHVETTKFEKLTVTKILLAINKMELELVISMLGGMVILALFLYFFRSALVLLLGPAIGLHLYRYFTPKCTNDIIFIAFYLSNVKKIVKFLLV